VTREDIQVARKTATNRNKLRTRACIAVFAVCGIAPLLASCYKSSENARVGEKPAPPPSPLFDASQVIDRYRSVDTSRDSVTRMQAIIHDVGSTSSASGRAIRLTLNEKRFPDGRRAFLVEFTDPPEERDRDGLVLAKTDGQVEGARYFQSKNSFVTSTSPADEDSLFGLTLQELVGGQPEKYDFTAIGEETLGSTPVYRLEGQLKPGAESKFAREVMLISKDNYTLLMSEFYDSQNELLRRLDVGKIGQVQGHWTRMKWTVTNPPRNKKVDFEVTGIKYDQNLSDSLFTREELKKIASR
jgi:outer membrane lipoprotein-sorting protein